MNARSLSLSFAALLDQWDTQGIAREVLAARGISVRGADLSEWANPNNPRTAPLHVVHGLERVIGKPIVSRAMAADIMGVTEESLSLAVIASQAAQVAAKASAKAIAADDDGIITPNEDADVQRLCTSVIDAFDALRRQVSAKAGSTQAAE